MDLRGAFADLSTAALRRIAAAHALAHDESSTRAELVERLVERLGDPRYLAELVAALPEAERASLLAASASGGEIRGFLLDRDAPGAAEALVERGLLFRTFAVTGPRRGEVFAVPDEILAQLPAPPPSEAPPGGEPPPDDRRTTDPVFSLFVLASTLQRPDADLDAEVQAWSAEPGAWPAEPGARPVEAVEPRASPAHAAAPSAAPADADAEPTQAAASDTRPDQAAEPTASGGSLAQPVEPLSHRHAPVTAGGGPRPTVAHSRWTFLRQLGLAAGCFVVRADGSLGPAPGLHRLLADRPALAERLWRTYLQLRGWSELAQAGIQEGDDLAEPTLVRQALVAALDRLEPGAWTRIDALSDWLQRTAPNVVREQLDARGRLLHEATPWEHLELPLLRTLLLGPLYWLGRLATSADGTHVARRAPPTHEPPPEPCTWASATELVAPPRADLGTLLQAERYLLLEERGRRSRYRLVQQHVAAALGGGGSLDECRRLLRRLSQQDLPPAVDARLQHWTERFGALAIRPAVVLEARTAAELEVVLDDPNVRPLLHGRLGPQVAEVRAADALELAAALRTADHLPRVDAALRLGAEPRHTYAGLVDEQVLEFLLVSLLAFQQARPERLAELEGALGLLERLEGQFPPDRLRALRAAARRLAGELAASRPAAPRPAARRAAGPSAPVARRARRRR